MPCLYPSLKIITINMKHDYTIINKIASSYVRQLQPKDPDIHETLKSDPSARKYGSPGVVFLGNFGKIRKLKKLRNLESHIMIEIGYSVQYSKKYIII